MLQYWGALTHEPLAIWLGGKTIVGGNVFRIVIMQFIDAWNFDVRAMKKSCVHIAQPDGRLIPFEAFNLLYREGKGERLEALRRESPGG
jgi:7,8-dihydro-6-hydroxymethylpterin dimethyltransferase